jgi:hypothetical protein
MSDTATDKALELIEEWGGIDGAHHKQWLLDQIVRTLTHTDEGYLAWVYEYEYPNGEDARDTYSWDEGVAP